MADLLYVYGTLRPGKHETVKIPGQLFDLGWFPGIKLEGPGEVVCEAIQVEDWGPIDRYEGYYPDCPQDSLYIRRPLMVPHGIHGFIYEYNRPVDLTTRIESGDWITYKEQNKRGQHGGNLR